MGDEPTQISEERARAAVALILRGASTSRDILFIKRARNPRDPWSGHMAFPGGRWETDDPSLLHTAMRETLEEVGLDLSSGSGPVEELSPLLPSSPQLPPLHIQPYVFEVGRETEPILDSGEVAAVHWVGLDALRDPSNQSTVEFTYHGATRNFPCFRVIPGEVVWGLTYRIVTEFLSAPSRR